MKDILFIGGGPAGYAGAIRAKQRGLDVAVIEKDRLGGTCLNRGCIPTKTLFKNAEVIRDFKQAAHYGLPQTDFSLDYGQVKKRKDEITEQLVSGVEHLMDRHKIETIIGTGRFKDEHTVIVGDREIQAKHIVIATGSAPALPNVPGIDLPGVITSDELLELEELPQRMAVCGTGVIGLEFASIFNEFGVEIHVIGSVLLRRDDSDIPKRLQAFMRRQGVKFHLGARFSRIEEHEDGLAVYFPTKKGGEDFVVVDKVLIASGRRQVFEELELDKVGIIHDAKGIKVNEKLQTNIEHIYACGDVLGRVQLAHLATAEAISIVETLSGNPQSINYDAVPSCTFVHPELASVGFTEDRLKEEGRAYKVSRFNFIANGKALSMDQTDGFVKVLADENNRLLGVHILGPGASDLIAEGTLALQNELTAENIMDTIHAHPTLAEAFWEAVCALDSLAIHQL
ncbi:MAG TPA: dihydrolipoyl dehydrogenase [Tissierellia bacterium]|nr:dihydrolipoyl dehydrogenase [Tissierellia bacterium]